MASGAFSCVVALCTAPTTALAQEEEKVLGWSKTAELSVVAISGNAESETFGLRSSFVKTMESSTLDLSAAGLRAESTTTRRTAVGSFPFTVQETSDTVLTAESYSASGRYDKLLSERLFWYGALTWERNEFAGFSERLMGIGGIGHLWWDREDSRFRTDYGLTWTSQDDLVANAAVDDSFLGARLSYDYWRQLTSTTDFASVLIVDQNIDESEDLRADFTNSLSISISDRLALKVSLQALYDNLPALGLLPIVDATGTPTGLTIPFELDELDTIFTTALVVNF
jgi:putative salt-induced outer membrane protein YdiY